MLKKIPLLFLILFSSIGFAQEDYTLMFYNLLNFPEAPPSNRASILNSILDNVQPDIFMVCELQNEAGANLILNQVLNDTNEVTYAMPDFELNTSSSFQELQQHLFYDESKFSLNFTDIIQTQLRDINYYQLEVLNNTESAALYLDIFVAHLKAAQGTTNEIIRSNMVSDFTAYLANLPEDANVIFAGDFNLYTANESAFLQLVMGQSTISFSDPINAIGDWNNNPSFANIHTQSTRTSNNNFDDFGAGGGMDDRFDFIMVSNNIMEAENDITYKENTYVAYGNNGNCYNKNISDTSCLGEFNQATRNLLYLMSDHLPVVMEVTNQNASLSNSNWNASNTLLSFPSGNIVEQELYVKFHASVDASTTINIYNQIGQKVYSFKKISNSTIIDVSFLSSGIYFVKLENFSENYKFLKQ